MANYKLGVDSSSSPSTYKLYNEATTIESPVTEVATINGLADGLIAADATGPIECPSSISVSGESGNYTITISNGALPEDLTANTTTISGTGEGYKIKLNSTDENITKCGASGTPGNPTVSYSNFESMRMATVSRTASAGWQEDSDTQISYTDKQVLATILNLKAETSSGITVNNNNTIEVGAAALGTSNITLNNRTGFSYTLTLADDDTIIKSKDAAANGYDLKVNTNSDGKATVAPKYNAYWTVADTQITYNQPTTESVVATVSNLSTTGASDSTVTFDESTKVFTLKNGALDSTNQNSVTVDTNDYTIALYDDSTDATNHVTRAGTEAAASFDWYTTAVDAVEGTPASTTAKLQKVLTAGWELEANSKNATYKQEQTLLYTTITGLKAGIDKTALPAVTTANSAITLSKDVLPTADGAVVNLANETQTDEDSVASSFTLALAEGIDAPGTDRTDTATNKIALGTITSGSVDIVQTFQAGWSLGTGEDAGKIIYKAPVSVKLGSISGLAENATADDITINNKTVTLNKNAVTTTAVNTNEGGDKRIKITKTELSSLTANYSDYGYTDADLVYGLALDNSTANKITNTARVQTGYNTVVTPDAVEEGQTPTTATATVTKKFNAYYSADKADDATENDPTTIITYHPEGEILEPADTLATVTGLAAAATATGENPTVIFNTSSGTKTITLKQNALIADTSNKVKIDTTGDTADRKYTLVLDGTVDGPGALTGEPTLNNTAVVRGTVTVEQTRQSGWKRVTDETSEDYGKIVYETPEKATLATITVSHPKADNNDSLANAFTLESTTIKVGAGALDNATEGSETTVSIVNNTVDGTTYQYALALNGVTTVPGGNDGDPYVAIVAAEEGDTKTAQYKQDLAAGWEIPTAADDPNKGNIVYVAKNTNNVLTTITGLNSSLTATEKVDDSTGAVTFATAGNVTTFTLKKAALPTTDGAVVTLNGTTGYALALLDINSEANNGGLTADEKAPGTQINAGTATMTLTDVEADGTTPATKTATITATLNEGWKLDDDENSDTYLTKITYTAPAANTVLATVTGLNTNAVYESGGNSNTVDFTITADDAADTGVITLKTNALTNSNVTLTDAKTDVAAFTLKLTNAEGTDVTGGKFGYEPTYAWTIDGTTATYRTSEQEGWTLDTTGNKSIAYDKEILAKDSTTVLATVSNLKEGSTVGTYTYTDGGVEKTIAAIGTGTYSETPADNTFVAGLYVTTEYSKVGESETAGTIYIAKDVLSIDASKPVTLTDNTATSENKPTGKYTFTLDSTSSAENEDHYVPIAKTDRNIWTVATVNGSRTVPASTTATYKSIETEFWTLDSNATSKIITYTPQADKATLATITGLADGLTVQDVGNYGSRISTLGKVVNNEFASVATVTDYNSASETTPGTIQLDAGALTTMNAVLTDGTGVKYDLELNDSGNGKVTETEFTSYKWTTKSVAASGSTPKTITATYTGTATAGYTLSEDKNTVKYTAAGDVTLATITGLDGNVKVNNSNADNQIGTNTGTNNAFVQGITVDTVKVTEGEDEDEVEYDAFKLADSVLGTAPTVTVKNTDTDIKNYKLALDDAVMDSTDAEITGGSVDTWRLNGTTATYRKLMPAYYTLDNTADSATTPAYHAKITYTAENAPDNQIYATITNLKSGLVLNDAEDDAGKRISVIGTNTGTNNAFVQGITVTKDNDKDVIELKEEVLANKADTPATLTNGTNYYNKNYTLTLDEDVDAVAIDTNRSMSWSVAQVAANGDIPVTKTATLKGATTAGWKLDTDALKVNYYAAKTSGVEFVKIAGLNNSVSTSKLETAFGKKLPTDETDGKFVLTADLLTASDVTITNGTLPDGTAVVYDAETNEQYGIALVEDLTNAAEDAIIGEDRWYFGDTDETKTTLALANIHDAHYMEGTLKTGETNKLYAANFQEDSSKITYVAEIKDTADITITNLASGLKLNGKGAYEGNGAYYVVDAENTAPVEGITVDDNTITLEKESVISKDTTKPTTITGGSFEFNEDNISKYNSTDIKKRFAVDGTTATLSEGTLEGYELTETDHKVVYHAEAFDTVAEITGLKSGLKVGTDENDQAAVGTGTGTNFKAGLTYDGTTITATTDVLDATVKTVAIESETYTLKLNEDVPTPDAGTGWTYTKGEGDNLATATYKEGTQAGWAAGTGSDAGKKFTYQDAAYTGDTVATLKGLANNLKVSDDFQSLVTSAGKAAVYEATNESTGDGTNEIVLTSYAFAKDDVTLTNAENKTYTLGLFQGQITQTDGTLKNDDGYVTNSVTTKLWDKAANSTKATYTINVPEGYNLDEDEDSDTYLEKVSYIEGSKQVATLNGVNSNLALIAGQDATENSIGINGTPAIDITNQTTTDDEGNEQTVEGKYVLTVDAAALNQAKLTLAKSDNFILDFENTKPDAPVWNKTANSTKAYYTQSYAADSYELAADAMSIAYTKNRVDTLFTLDGLDKDLVATNSKESITDSSGNVKVTVTKKPKTSTSSNVFAETTDEDETETINIVQLSSRNVLNSGSAVKLTNGKVGTVTQDYRLWLGTDTTDETEAAKGFASDNYANNEETYHNQPLWTVDNKGKATLDEGTYEGWSYKVNKDGTPDYTNLVYVKPTKVITATLTGLATNLMVDPETGDIYTTNTDGTAKDEAVSFTPKEGTNPGTISLTSAALPTGNLKNNTKIALALGKVNGTTVDYKLSGEDVSEDDIATDDDYSTWSINKGTASYQYGTSKGWTFSDTGAVYTDEKKTVVAKISGINKTLNTFTGTDDKGKPADVPWSTDVVEEHIKVDVTGTEQGKQTFTFTLLDADYLAGSKVTLKKANNKDTNTYFIQADESLKPYNFAHDDATHGAQWTVNTKNGSAKLTAGTSAGYTNLKEGEKNYGTVVNYTKEKTDVTYFTISGLVKEKDRADGATKLDEMIVENGAITYDVANQKVSLNNAAVLGTSTVSLTSGKDANKQAYAFTFDADSLAAAENNSNIDTNYDITLQAKGSTVNLVETAEENKFALSTDGKKLNYNKKNVDTVLATIKGLNKNLVNNASGVVTSETSTEPVVTLDGEYKNATITLAADALANSNITFTTNKKLDDHTYTLALAKDDAIITTKQTQTEWTFSNGTASYRNYTKGYYTSDEKGGYKYTKETKGTTYATITGLNPNANATAIEEALNEATGNSGSTINYGGTITLDSSMLVTTDKNNAASGKAVTLKNSATKNEHETTFALDLDTTGLASAMISTFSVVNTFTNGKLTGSYSPGYSLASDTSITYLAKEKGNQVVATLNGTTGTVTANNDTISLSENNLTGKSVTLTTTDLATVDYKLSFTDTGRGITSADDTDDRSNGWEVKNGKATFTGYVTSGYKLAGSGKAITYNKAVGTPASGTNAAKPAVAMTISNVTAASGDSDGVVVTGTTDGKATTLSNGLIAVEFSGSNIVGSGEADTITLTTAASVKGGKGDDYITLSSGNDTILYGNGDGNDVVESFTASDKIILTGGKLTGVVTNDDGYAVVKVGTGSITLNDYSGTVNVYDSKGATLHSGAASSSDVLFEDNNYSTDAAALSDIVEPFKASYTPYDFESGLDLVKKDSFTPAVTYNGDDKK